MQVFSLISVPVNVRLPEKVALPVNVPDRAAPLMVVAVRALTEMLGVPDKPAAVPDVLAALFGMSLDSKVGN